MAISRDAEVELTSYKAESYWQIVYRRLKKHKLAIVSLILLIFIILACIFGPFFVKYHYNDMESYDPNNPLVGEYRPPSNLHPFGTDELGRDTLSRVLYGGRISLFVGFASVFSSIIIGVFVGALSGYYGGLADTLLMRFTDIMFSIPVLPLLVVLASVIPGGGVWKIILVITIFGWMTDARIVRGVYLSLKEQEFAEAARAIGASNARIIWRHLLPNSMAPIIVSSTLGVGGNIIYEAALSYLGFGIMPPTPSWGNMLQNAQSAMFNAPWLIWFPGLAIFVTVLAFNFLGDGLRDALDPRLKV
ncbi:MAG: oligopeptide ABC transporter permease [Caldisericia bacterium]